MSYSKDLREKAVKYRLAGNTIKKTCEIFGIGNHALNKWVKQYNETGDLSNKPLNRSFKKIDPQKLMEYIEEHPDAYQKEIAEIFGCTDVAISKAMKRLGITRKKRQRGTKNKVQKK